jgi:hypothetical protein
MLRRSLGALVVALVVGGFVLADETSGRVTKVEDGSITITTRAKKRGEKGEEKTFKVSKDVKVTKTAGKDKEEVKLTLDELKTAIKVTSVSVTITHDGDTGTAIKVGGLFGGFRPNPKDKKKDDKKKDDQ